MFFSEHSVVVVVLVELGVIVVVPVFLVVFLHLFLFDWWFGLVDNVVGCIDEVN